MNWLEWKPEKIEGLKPDIKQVCQKVVTEKKLCLNQYQIDYKTIRKVFTTGIKPDEFLTALNPENGTYFGLKTEPTHTTKERLVMFGDTIGAALDARKSFTFQCVNRKERNELVIVAATMLTGGWIIKLNDLAVSAEPSQGQKVLLEEKRFEGIAHRNFFLVIQFIKISEKQNLNTI